MPKKYQWELSGTSWSRWLGPQFVQPKPKAKCCFFNVMNAMHAIRELIEIKMLWTQSQLESFHALIWPSAPLCWVKKWKPTPSELILRKKSAKLGQIGALIGVVDLIHISDKDCFCRWLCPNHFDQMVQHFSSLAKLAWIILLQKNAWK